ncbi:MAG: polysaccharide deacetylase family protein [Ruthenibacterium lactatiformans]
MLCRPPFRQHGRAECAAADKVVYLTLDDGPSATTESVLDTLKAEGVPAIFRSWRRTTTRNTCPAGAHRPAGTIALHTCSHDYKSI